MKGILRHALFGVVVLLVLFGSYDTARAYVQIDSAVSTAQLEHLGGSPTTVFISDTTGYTFFVDSTGDCKYRKSTDSGASWATVGNIDTQTDVLGIAVWYDQWTPGDTSGTLIHILTWDAADVYYTSLNTSGDTASTTVNATSTNQGGSFVAGENIPSITKATDGDLYMGIQDNSDSFVIRCPNGSNCTQLANWTETASNPFDLQPDHTILMPLASGNVLAIRRDISADDIQSKVYTDSGTPSWSGSWATVDANAPENATYDGAFGATIDKNTNDIYLAYDANTTALGNNDDDIRTAIYTGSWTSKTEAVSDSLRGITDVKIAFDQNNNDVYVVYAANASPGISVTTNVYWKKSIDGMTSWIGIEGPLGTVDLGDIYGVRANILSSDRLYVTWYEIASDDLFGDTIADLSASTDVISIGSSGFQTESILLPSTDQHVGAFTFIRDSGSANVTSITVNEEGTVNANTYITNLDIRYETAASCVYDGTETLFGTASSFNASDQATVTGTMAVGTSQVCVYMIVDASNASAANTTLKLEITDPSADIAVSSGAITQKSRTLLWGATNLRSITIIDPVEIDGNVSTDVNSQGNNSTSNVFTTDKIGYTFYRDSDNRVKYSKTLDGGATWGSAVQVDPQTDAIGVAVWYDRWTPGDTTGNYIHIATIDSGNDTSWYTRLDTTNDSISTSVITAADQGGSLASAANNVAITKTTDGDLYIGASDNSDSWVHRCDPETVNCTVGTNWAEITQGLDLQPDFLYLMPTTSDDLMAIRFDADANDYDYRIWDGSAWGGSGFTTISATSGENTLYDPQMGVAMNLSTNAIYLAFVDDSATLGTNDDIETWVYTGSWSVGGNVLTNDTKGLMNVALSVDQNTGDVYAVYTARTVPGLAETGQIYVKKSTNGMTSWGSESEPATDIEAPITGLGTTMSPYGRIYAAWYGDGYNRIMGTTIGDIAITISGTSNLSSGTVALAVDTALQSGKTGTISGGTWSIGTVAKPASGSTVSVWVDSASDTDESTGITKYDGSGDISGMILNQNVLSLGSDDNQSLTVSNLNQYDCTEDEDIMHQAESSLLSVQGSNCAGASSNSYSNETITILSGDTLTIGGTESLATDNVDIAGTLTSGGASSYTISGNWNSTGTFTPSTSTVTFNDNTQTSSLTYSADTTFSTLAISTGGKAMQFDEAQGTIVTTALTIQGADCTTGRVFLDSTANDDQWNITVTGATVDIDYADIEDSNAVTTGITAENSTADNDNNTNWTVNGGACIATISISGSANGSDSATVKVAVNNTIKAQTGTISSGSWTISGVSEPSSGDIITVWIDSAGDSAEAIGITKYAGSDITGMVLNALTLSLGSSDNQTISNTNISQYDNNVSSNEDIFYDVDGNNDLIVCSTSGSTDCTLSVLLGNTYRLDSGNSGNATAENLSNMGTLTADGNTIYIAKTLTSSGTFNANTSTVNFNGAGSQTIPALNYYHLIGSSASLEITNLGSGTTTNDPTTTNSVSWTPGSRGIVVVSSVGSGGIYSSGEVTVSGGGVTWNEIGFTQYASRRGFYVFFSSDTPTNGTLSIDDNDGDGTFQELMYSIEKVTGFNISTPYDTPVTGSATDNLTLGDVGTPDTGDAIYSTFAHEDGANNFNFTAGITELSRESGGTNVRQLLTGYELDGSMDETPGATSSGGNNGIGGVAFIINMGTSGIGPRTLASSDTIGIAGTFTPGDSSYTVTGSTVDFNGSGTQTVNADFTYNNLQVRPSANSVTTNFASGTVTVGGNLTIGNGTNTSVVVNANNASTTLTIDGSVSISTNTALQANASNSLTIGDDFTNNGTFTHNSGTIVFNDNSKTSSLNYSTDTTFSNLTISTGGKAMQFDEAQGTIVTTALTIQGADCTTGRVFLDSTVNDDQWNITVTGATVDIDYADIEDSNAVTTGITAENSTADNDNNTNWTVNGGACGGNSDPNPPTSLTQKDAGDAAITESAWTTTNTPKLGFTITDPDSDTVKYEVQVASDSGFSSLILDYTHGSFSASGTTFTFVVGTYGSGSCSGTCPATLSDSATGYWWRVKAIDDNSAESAYVEFGVAGTMDIKIDATAPTGGTVYDGTSGDQDWNDGSLTELSGNWTGFDANVSGVQKYEYALRRQPDGYYWSVCSGAGAWQAGEQWCDNSTSTSFTQSTLNLTTGTTYSVSVKTTDNAGNIETAVDSNGQQVLPMLSFSLSGNTISFNNLNAANSYTDTKTIVTTTSTNATNGYTIKVYNTDTLRSTGVPATTIPDFSGTWSAPASWGGGQYGFGYTSNDTNVQGSNRFSGGTAYAAFSQSPPGDVVADHTDTVDGSTGAITNQNFTITYKVSASNSQAALHYETSSIFIVTANY